MDKGIVEVLDIISQVKKSGMSVYVQTPFLKDCNDKGPELTRLFSLLRGAGAELHYIYIPCSPIHGNSVYWTLLSEGVEISNYLRAHLSDRVMPRICTATPIGKMDWHSIGWAVEPVRDNDHFVWIRTPYDPEYYKAFAPELADTVAEECRSAERGCVECKKQLAGVLNGVLEPIREKRAELLADRKGLEDTLRAGADRAREIARPKMEKIRELVGFWG